MKKILLSLFIGLVIIPASVIGVLHSLNKNHFFALDEIHIVISNGDADSPFLKPLVQNINDDLEKLKGQSLWDLSLDQVSEKVSSADWIETLRVSRKWPSGLKLEIVPKTVELVYLKSSGEMYPLVSDGSFLNPVGTANAPDAAILQGEVFEKDLGMRQKAINAVHEIPSEGKFSRKNISALHFDQKTGFWATLVESGMKVKMGEDRISLKAQRVSQVLEYMESRGLEARVIDANLSKKVLVRLRKDP
jgi:cell division protein FtsQ